MRQDARTPDGGPAASSPEFLARDLLDTHGIEGALLNCFDAGGLLSAQTSTEETIVLASRVQRLLYRRMAQRRSPTEVCTCRAYPGPRVIGNGSPPYRQASSGRSGLYPACQRADGAPLLLADLRGLRGARASVYVHVTGIESIFSGTPTLAMGTAAPTSSATRRCRKWAWRA